MWKIEIKEILTSFRRTERRALMDDGKAENLEGKGRKSNEGDDK